MAVVREERQQEEKDEEQAQGITGEKERHLVEKGRKGELRLSSRKKVGGNRREEGESRTGGGGRTLRSRGMKENRVAAEGLVMLADETRRGMVGYTCRRND